jgi:AcrR family transcriptional regulator
MPEQAEKEVQGPVSSRRTAERRLRRQLVLGAARGLFAAQGVENVTMEDIAAEAGYTRRTLYAYFRSRDEISLLILLEDLQARWAYQKAAMAEVGGGLGKILAWAAAFYAYARENPGALRLQAWWDFKGIDPDRIDPEVFSAFEALNNELADGLREVFRQGIEDGSLRPTLDVDLCISHFIYTLRTVLNRALSPTYSFARFDPDDYVQAYLDLFSRGIRNPGGSVR